MGDILVYIDPSINERLLAFARPLADAAGGKLVALVAGGDATAAERVTAADVVLQASHPALDPYTPEAHLAVIDAAITERKPDLLLLENTTTGYDLAAAAAARSGRPFVGYCLGLTLDGAAAEAVSAVYGGQLEATINTPLPAVVAVNSTALKDDPQVVASVERAELTPPAELDNLRTAFVEAVEPSDEGVDLTKAERIVCVGRGIGGTENIPIAEELADALDAEIAASRPVVDSGWLPKVRQVGKSGAHVKPKLYLTLGVSGAPEHVEGMQSAELIIAVNKDPGAAIFNIAHYGVVGDLFDVADELTSLLSE